MCELQKHACFYNLDIVPTNLEYCLDRGGSGTLFEAGDNSKGHQLKQGEVAGKCGSEVCPPFAECHTVASNQSTVGTVQVCHCPSACPQGTSLGVSMESEKCCNMQVGIQTNCPMIPNPQMRRMKGPSVLLARRMAISRTMQIYVNCERMPASGKLSWKCSTTVTAVCPVGLRCLTNLCAN